MVSKFCLCERNFTNKMYGQSVGILEGDEESRGMDAMDVRGRPPTKCKMRLLDYLRESRDGEA